MTVPLILVVVFTAVALGLAAFALFTSISARRDAREAGDAARSIALALARRKREERAASDAPPGLDEREVNVGPPREVGERRQRDDGASARHRAPDDARARRRDHDDPQWSTGQDAPPPEELATVEHPAPTGMYRKAPPLPRPGQIGREQ